MSCRTVTASWRTSSSISSSILSSSEENEERLLAAHYSNLLSDPLPEDTQELMQRISQFCDRGEELIRVIDDEMAGAANEDCTTEACQLLRPLGKRVRARLGGAHKDRLNGPKIIVDRIARPGLALRVIWVQWNRGLVLGASLVPVWLFIVGSDSVVYMPVVFGMFQLALLFCLISTIPEGRGVSWYGSRFGFLACLASTLQAGLKLHRILFASVCETEDYIRAAFPTSAMLQIYISTGMYFMGRRTVWELYRIDCVLMGLCGACACLALRAIAGPDISYPPGFTSFIGSMACWCELFALGAVCTPRFRRCCKESMCVVPLQVGVQLTKEHDSAATLSSHYTAGSPAAATLSSHYTAGSPAACPGQ